MSKFRTQFGMFKHAPDLEKVDPVSLTQPDQSMSIQEIMRRFRAGLPLEGQRVPLYEGEDAVPIEVAHMDLIDREMALRAAKEELAETKKRVADAVREANNKRVQKIVDKRVAETLEQKARFEKQSTPNNESSKE